MIKSGPNGPAALDLQHTDAAPLGLVMKWTVIVPDSSPVKLVAVQALRPIGFEFGRRNAYTI